MWRRGLAGRASLAPPKDNPAPGGRLAWHPGRPRCRWPARQWRTLVGCATPSRTPCAVGKRRSRPRH
eukprot:8778294-Lingulodinium_polyedra.AAC.1